MHSWGTNMACVTQAVTRAITIYAVLHAHTARTGHMQGLDLRIDFDGISSTSRSVGFWAQGCKDLRTAARRRRQRRASWMKARIHTAHTWRGSLKLTHMPSSCSAACTFSACRLYSVWACEVLVLCLFGGIVSTVHGVALHAFTRL